MKKILHIVETQLFLGLSYSLEIITKTCSDMQNTEFFFSCKKANFIRKNLDIFLLLSKTYDIIGCGYSLEPNRPGGSNESPQSMFGAKKEK